ncbi:hypothetical protein LIER_11775 [Lithospermum erythrorhizon]|uniref:Glycine-rich protein n=1 Tax=Lithospermum erythrorhizon TaxID=34254 RepID=A0AAV3PQQ6_LITER
MASWYVMFVFAIVLVHATARDIPSTKQNVEIVAPQHEEIGNVVTAKEPAAASGVDDEKNFIAYGGIGGFKGIGGYVGVLPALGGVGGIGSYGGIGIGGGIGGAGGVGGLGGVGGAGGMPIGGVVGGIGKGIGGGVVPSP